ncbi:MAG: alpha/beta fold hydrolase [Bacteroidales bacterium]
MGFEREINKPQINFRARGEGIPLVLLHGYLESLDTWNDFAAKIEDRFRVITPDLPGHGKSEQMDEATIEWMADAVDHVLDKAKEDRCIMIGHSMGGYVALAYAEKYAQKLMGLGLFHSTPFADTEEKKNNRQREIELVKAGKKQTLINTNIPKMYADDNLEKMKDKLENSKKIALSTPDSGIIYALECMMSRPDRSKILGSFELPFFLVLGKKDNYIPFDTISKKMPRPPDTQTLFLENSGHMGFIEEEQLVIDHLKYFGEHCKLFSSDASGRINSREDKF